MFMKHETTTVEEAQLDIINMAEGIFSSAANKINMTFSIVRGPEKIDACTQTHYKWLLHNFSIAIWYWGSRDIAQLFTGNTNVDNPGAAYPNTTYGSAKWATSFIKYPGFPDAERARMSVHEMAHNLNATDTNLTHQHIGEGVKWYEQQDTYVSLMHYINTTAGWLPTNYFSDGTKRMFTSVSDSQRNNTKWILIAASRDLYY